MVQPNNKKEYNSLFERIEEYIPLINAIFNKANKEAAKIVINTNYDGKEMFSFAEYPETREAIRQLQDSIASGLNRVVISGIQALWDYSNGNLDKLVRQVLGKNANNEKYKHYFDNNESALKAFIARKIKGLNLSQRIWSITEGYIWNLENVISDGIAEGVSAAELSRSIRKCLLEPDNLFRRVRNKYGKLVWSQRAETYHPGMGKYRSAYKNAMRVTRSEINMAYRLAEHIRWQKLDFVVGFEVKRSGHVYDCPVCAALAGKYPKDFKFTGWHPQCRCYVVPVLKTDEEIQRDNNLILLGRKVSSYSVNQVTVVNYALTEWIEANKDRVKSGKSIPYFISENKQYINI